MGQKRHSPPPDLWLIWVIRVAAAAAVFAPLYLSPTAISYSAFDQGTVIQICAEVAVAAWIVLLVADRRYRPDWRQPFVIAATALIAWMFLTLLWSADPSAAFWGGRRRVMAGVQYLHYYLFFLALVSTFRADWREWRRLFFCSNLAALWIGALAAREWWASGFATRVMSNLGNPIHLGIYAALNFCFAVILLFEARRRWTKIFYATAAAFHVSVAVAMTATGSAVVGLAAAVAVGGLLLVGTEIRGRRLRWGVYIAVACLAVALTASAFALRSPAGQTWSRDHLPFFAVRLVTMTSDANRLSLWRIGWQGFLERPLLGQGLESYQLVFSRLFDPAGRDRFVTDIWTDRPHNQFLDVALTLGLVGLAIYLAWWLAIFVGLARLTRAETEPSRRRALVGLTAFFAAYAAAIFFFLDAPTHTSLLWLAAAAVAGLGRSPARRVEDEARVGQLRPNPIILVAVLIVLSAVEFQMNLLPQVVSAVNTKGCLLTYNDPARAESLLRWSLSRRTYLDDELRLRAVDCLIASDNVTPFYWRRLDPLAIFTAQELERSAAAHPNNYFILLGAARAERLAADFEPARWDQAASFARQALALGPLIAEAREEMALADLAQRGPETAITDLRAALPFAQTYNDGIGRIHYWLATAETSRGNLDGAFDEMKAALKLRYSLYDHAGLIVALAKILPSGPTDSHFAHYLMLFEARHSAVHPDIQRARAIAAFKAGDEATARQIIGQIARFDQATADLTRQDIGLSVMTR